MVKSKGNYYHILGVDERSTPEDIKKAYRQLAVKYHPDRNPDNRAAEEQFKLISEAYAVLSNPARKLQYDRERVFRAGPGAGATQGQGPRPGGRGFTSSTQEEIFKEFFNNARSRQMFEELSKEFRKSGLRFDEKFFDKVFFGGRGFFFGGVFFSGQPGKERVQRDDRPDYRTTLSNKAKKAGSQTQPAPLPKSNPIQAAGKFLGKVGRGLVDLTRTAFSIQEPEKTEEIPGPSDIRFNLTISAHQAAKGADVEVAYQRNGKLQRVTVKVPAGTNDGAKLRLRGMGNGPEAATTGDLFLSVRVVQ